MLCAVCDSEAMAGEKLKVNRDFYDDKWSKHRIITSLDWSVQVGISVWRVEGDAGRKGGGGEGRGRGRKRERFQHHIITSVD